METILKIQQAFENGVCNNLAGDSLTGQIRQQANLVGK